MFELNGTYVIFIGMFIVFIYLLNEIMLKPVGKAMDKRAQSIRTNLEASKTCMQESQKLIADYQAKLHKSRLEAQSIIQGALAEEQKQRDAKLKDVQAEGRNKLDALKTELTQSRQGLLQSLIHPELELVGNIINKLLGEKPALVTDENRVLKVLEETR